MTDIKIMGKTVTTYLIDGDPKGTQYVFISNKICQMYENHGDCSGDHF